MKPPGMLRLEAPHPYVPDSGAELTVEVWPALPGPEFSTREARRSAETSAALMESDAPAWTAVAGPYRLEAGRYYEGRFDINYPGAEARDRAALMSLLWDLMGLPMSVGGGRRRRATFVVVEGPDGITVYRDARECLTCELARGLGRKEAA